MNESTTELAWAAGYLQARRARLSKSMGRIKLQLHDQERETIERLRGALGGGVIYGPYRGRFMWVVEGNEAKLALEKAEPYFTILAAK